MIRVHGATFGIQPGALDGVDHRARGNRGARKLVKLAAVFFFSPQKQDRLRHESSYRQSVKYSRLSVFQFCRQGPAFRDAPSRAYPAVRKTLPTSS